MHDFNISQKYRQIWAREKKPARTQWSKVSWVINGRQAVVYGR